MGVGIDVGRVHRHVLADVRQMLSHLLHHLRHSPLGEVVRARQLLEEPAERRFGRHCFIEPAYLAQLRRGAQPLDQRDGVAFAQQVLEAERPEHGVRRVPKPSGAYAPLGAHLFQRGGDGGQGLEGVKRADEEPEPALGGLRLTS